MAKKRIFILGAGISGLSAAWHLKEKGVDCKVFEKEKDSGGLCRSKNINGFTFDYDGHLLHFKHAYAFNLIKNLLGGNLVEHNRSAWIYCFDKYIRYPFQANLHGLPHSIIKECLVGFVKTNKKVILADKKEYAFSDWVNQVFGEGIARHFMVPYNAKFWTVSPKELTCEWVDGFIPVPSLSQIIEGTIEESKRQFGYNSKFWYPKKGGIGQIVSAFKSRIKNIYNDCGVESIDLNKRELTLSSGDRERFDYLISTIPLPDLPYIIKGLPNQEGSLFKKLRWNSIFNLNLGIDKRDSLKRHWVYFPQKEICFFRVGFFHNFSASLCPSNKSSLYVELSYSNDKPIAKSKIVSRIKDDLKKVGLIAKGDRICAEDINDIKYGYPIYDNNYNSSRGKIIEYLLKNNIISCGRYGSWRYMSIEDSILDGLGATRQLR